MENRLLHAERAGEKPSFVAANLAYLRFFGSTPVVDLLCWLDEFGDQAGRDHFLRAYRAGALAMLGRIAEARALVAESRTELAARGDGILLANLYSFESVWIELWAGDAAAAVEYGSEGWRRHQALRSKAWLSDAAGTLARGYYALGRLDTADEWARRAAELVSGDSPWSDFVWRQVRAKVLARRAEQVEAEKLAEEAVRIAEQTDLIDQQGDAYADLAEVLVLGGKMAEAAAALEHALARYRRKGNLVSERRASAELSRLGVRPAGTGGP
jgi:tetratricopeptide (TPR) repeat protein